MKKITSKYFFISSAQHLLNIRRSVAKIIPNWEKIFAHNQFSNIHHSVIRDLPLALCLLEHHHLPHSASPYLAKMIFLFILIFGALIATPSLAQDTIGCDGFFKTNANLSRVEVVLYSNEKGNLRYHLSDTLLIQEEGITIKHLGKL